MFEIFSTLHQIVQKLDKILGYVKTFKQAEAGVLPQMFKIPPIVQELEKRKIFNFTCKK